MALFLILLLLSPMASAKLVSREERLTAVSRARLREAIDPSTRDALKGPEAVPSYGTGEEVRCKYEEKDPLKPIGGHTKKFPCHDAQGRRLKVKYDVATNPEVAGEVLGSRLFWLLGFYAEPMYSVKIVCDNCPADPFKADAKAPRATRTFEPATLQTRLPGTELSETEGEGWQMRDLDAVDADRGGASKADVDALKLLIVLVHHGDNTANQQRLLCASDDPKCAHPMMYVTDLGGTFGGRENSTSYRLWSRRKIWRDAANCVADFEGTDSSFKDPEISEAGRALLASLLAKLSDEQLLGLFKAGRVDALAKHEPAVIGKNGKARRVTAEDWVEAFKKKREEIASAKCPR